MKIQYSKLLVGILIPLTSVYSVGASLTPPDAKPGECYARVMAPATYETVTDKVMVKEATEEISIVPAEYETVEKQVEIIPANTKLIPIPATYKEVLETIEIRPAYKRWKTSLSKKALPVSKVLLDAIQAQGLNLDGVPAGTCYKEYFQAARYKVVTEEFVIQNERNETEIIPAQFEAKEEKIIIRPMTKEVVEIPAEYEYVEEKVLIEEARTVWKKGQNPAQALSGATGEIMCLVKVPAKYKTIKKLIVKSVARTEVQEIAEEVKIVKVEQLAAKAMAQSTVVPAVHKTIEKKVLDTPASFMWVDANEGAEKPWRKTGNKICLVEKAAVTKEIKKIILDMPATVQEETIPATYKTVKVAKLVTEAKELRTPAEAEYKMIEKRKKVSDSHVSWERILCQTNMTKSVIKQIQVALNAKEYNTGEPDGVLGRGTRNSLEKYQKDNSLATGGITYETLSSLNIEL